MLSKLAFKNASKSIRDYAVYFFTLVLAICIFYMFNSIYAQKDIMVVSETTAESMKALKQILSYISVFVAVVLGFLIVYANNFLSDGVKNKKRFNQITMSVSFCVILFYIIPLPLCIPLSEFVNSYGTI